MKLLLIIILGLCFIFLGIAIKNQYLRRIRFWDQLIAFTDEVIREISFFKDDFQTIAFSKPRGKEIELMLKQFFDAHFVNLSFLNKDENGLINEYLSSIGRLDAVGEINNISYYLNLFKSKQNHIVSVEQSNINMYSKLVALAGIIVCIIFL